MAATPDDLTSARAISGTGSKAKSRLLTSVLVAPAGLWYLVLLVLPLAIVVVFSFGTRAPNGGYQPAFTVDNYLMLLTQPQRLSPFITSLWMAVAGTIGCLLVGLPLAYFMASRAGKRKGLLVLLMVIPFWTSFLIRTYSWLIILGRENIGGFVGALIGDPDFRILGTPVAVLMGLIYGYLPLMVFPLYVTLERMDWTLNEASKDLGAARGATFFQVTLPLSLPGLITGSILVFIPMMGEYVIPAILGYGRTFLAGNALVDAFIQTRNWPFGSAMAVGLILIMLTSVSFYVWFMNRGRAGREVSVL